MAPAGDLCHEENKILNVTLLSAHNITGPSNISITDLLNITELSGLNITGKAGRDYLVGPGFYTYLFILH